MKKIIGVGSVWAADQIGLQVVDYLKTNKQGSFITLTNPYNSLINAWGKGDEVLIIDAFKSPSIKQEILICNLNLLKKLEVAPAISTHNFTLLESLLLAESLKILPRRLNLFLININNCNDSFNAQKIKFFAEKAFNHTNII